MPTTDYMRYKFGDSGYVKAPCPGTIILNAVTCNNSKMLKLKIIGRKFMLTPKIMQTTKTYMNDPVERGMLDMVADI